MQESFQGAHFHLAANHQGRPLVDVGRLNLQNRTGTIGREPAGLLGDEGYRVGLKKQAQFALRVLVGGRVKKNAPFK